MTRLNQFGLAAVLLCVAVWMNYKAISDFVEMETADRPPDVKALLVPTPETKPSPQMAAQGEQAPTGDILIQSSRLPIRMHTEFVAGKFPIAVGAGSIQVVNDKILIMDRRGAFFLWDGRNASSLQWPALPNNGKQFEDFWKQGATIDDLRTHDVKFDPTSGTIYASFESFDSVKHGLQLTVARLSVDARTLASKGDWVTLFKGTAIATEKGTGGIDAGGKLLIANNKLYFSTGDYVQSDTKLLKEKLFQVPPAQDPKVTFGKTYSMTLVGGAATMFTMGHRNPQGLAARADGSILETEHGPRGGDKLNVLEKGKNYGWPYLTEGSRYGGYQVVNADAKADSAYQDALFNFVPAIAPTALMEVRGFDEAWDGDVIVASLKARSLFRIHIKGDRVTFVEPIWIGLRVRDIESRKGQLILWTDDGSIVTLDVDRDQLASGKLTDTWMTRNANFAGNCAYCHAGQGATSVAPPLDDVYGRPIGGAPYNRYTKALKSKTGVWDENTLYAFIKYPAQYVPGTAMPDTDLSDQKIKDIIGTLKENAQYGKPPSLSRGLIVAP